jgi:3-phosphoinositide dependent protein kinase-1
MENICGWCGKENVSSKCSLCKTVFYCNRECQVKHWASHKLTCEGHKPPRSIEDFEFLELLGTGNFSEIIHVKERRTGKEFALKKMEKQRVNQLHKQADVMMEKHALTRLKGVPGVVQLFETFKNDFELYFLTEKVRGKELWSFCKVFGLRELEARFYLKQLVETFKVLHSMGIVHRDIKTENVMITEDFTTTLIDFGTAKDFQHPEVEVPGNSMRKKKFENFIGTPHFMAPECINNKDSNYKSDVWSFGCMTFYVLAGFPCFSGGSDYLIFTKALALEYQFPEFFSDLAKDFISACLKLNHEERPTMDELAQHDFIKLAPDSFPLPFLEDLAVERIRDMFFKEESDEAFLEKFPELLERFESPRMRHLGERLKHHFSKEGTGHMNQGI